MTQVTETTVEARLAELAGGLSLAGDLADGFATGKVIRTAALAVTLAKHAGVSFEDQRRTYFVSLIRFLGCTGFAHEESSHFGAGDDIGVRSAMALADPTQPLPTLSRIVDRVGRHARLPHRARAIARLLRTESMLRHSRAQCDASLHVAAEFGLDGVDLGVRAMHERFDGRGGPDGTSGDALPLAARLHHVADVLETTWHRSSWEDALREIQRRSGGQLDPALVNVAVPHATHFRELLECGRDWEVFLAAEPEPHVMAGADRLDRVAAAMGRLSDLKTVSTLGHSSAVAERAVQLALALGLPPEDVGNLRRAGHLHDIGRVGVSNAIWDKPGGLSRLERESAEVHTALTERILSRSPALARLAPLCAAAHERLDGSGYHRRLPPSAVDRGVRVLAVADVAVALTEARPHRPAFAPDRAAAILREEAAAGKLDRAIVEAALDSAHGPRRKTAAWPGGLSDREVEVLRFVARGKTNREIATLLDISAKTVQHHVASCYDKLGIYSRAGAALVAMEHGLL